MNYATIKKCDVANGPGVRVSLYVSGCTHHCKGCFNQETWDFAFGKPFTRDQLKEILEDLEPEYIRGFSLLGGEPFEPANQEVLVGVLRHIRERYPKKTIWCYSGYTYEQLTGCRQQAVRHLLPESWAIRPLPGRCWGIWMCWWTGNLWKAKRT